MVSSVKTSGSNCCRNSFAEPSRSARKCWMDGGSSFPLQLPLDMSFSTALLKVSLRSRCAKSFTRSWSAPSSLATT